MELKHCINCQSQLTEDQQPYTLKIELYQSVEESLNITKEDLAANFDDEIQKIIAQMESMSAQEREIEEERVYTAFTFTLCVQCRDHLANQLRRSLPLS